MKTADELDADYNRLSEKFNDAVTDYARDNAGDINVKVLALAMGFIIAKVLKRDEKFRDELEAQARKARTAVALDVIDQMDNKPRKMLHAGKSVADYEMEQFRILALPSRIIRLCEALRAARGGK